MKLAFFIAKRVALSDNQSFSKLIIRIAIIAIALSLSVMIIATALIAGFKNEISTKLFGLQGHIHIMDFDSNESVETVPINRNQEFYTYLDSLNQFLYLDQRRIFGYTLGNTLVERRTKGGIRHIQVFAEKPSIFKTSDEIEGVILKGVSYDYDWSFLQSHLIEGRIINMPDSTMSSEIIISKETSKRLKLNVGDKFLVYFVRDNGSTRRRFEVVGIYNTGLAEKDERYAIIDIRQIQKLNGWSQEEVSGFEVFIDNLSDLDAIGDKVYDLIPMNLYSQTIRNKDAGIFDWLELQNVNEWVILVLMIIVCIINMATGLLILILERTNMIGILKSLGEGNWNIQKIFLSYGAYIAAIGLFWGNIIGISLCLIQKYFEIITLPEADYYVSVAPIDLSFWTILALNIGTLLITVLILIIPSFLVRRITPVQAIRFK